MLPSWSMLLIFLVFILLFIVIYTNASVLNFGQTSIPIIHGSDEKPPYGIENVGNTCFFNSGAQLFYRMTDLKDFLIQPNVMNHFKDGPVKQYINIIKEMETST